ncbi:MAG: TolC family outer membrane protein [Pseudomonadota bacterium]
MQMLRAGATLKLRPYAARLRRSAALGAAAALALLPLAQSASAETLSDALAEAVRNSARIEAQRQVVFGQDENVEQARSGLRPSITGQASAGAVHTDNSESPKSSQRRPTSLSLTGTQTLYDGGQTQNAVDSASATVRGAEQTLVQTEQTVLLDAVDAYVSVLAAEENVALASNNVRVIGEALEAAQDRFEVGEVTRTDVAQAEARLAEARATLTQQQGVLNQERVSYQRQIGSAPGRLAALPALPPLPASLDDAVAIARRDHPSITAARFNVDSASATVRQARGALLPQISAQGVLQGVSEGTNDTSGQFSASAEVTITVPFYQGGALRSEVFQSQALADQRRAELSQTTREIIESVGIAWQNLITARAQIDSNRSQIRAARIALEGVQEEAKVGARTTLDVLDAEQELLDAQTTLVDSRSQEYIAAYSLLSAIGRLTVAHLDLDVELRPRGRPSYVGGQPLSRALPQTEDTQWRRNWRP